jgi:hypothetical protein
MIGRISRVVPILVIAACGGTTNGTGPGNYDPSIGDASVAPSASPCTTNAECAGAALCVSGKCVAVDQKVCMPNVLPSVDALRSDNTVVVAAFVPLQFSAPLMSPSGLAYALALKELEQAGGIPGTPRRNLAMILCASEPSSLPRAVEHVTRELRLPALVGNFQNLFGDQRLHYVQLAAKENVFTVNPDASPELAYADVKGLAWNLTGSTEDVALAYRPLLQRAETYVKSRPDRPAGPLKVAVLSKGGAIPTVLRYGPVASSTGTRDPSKAAVFNGKDIAGNGADFIEVAVGAGARTDGVAGPIRALSNFRPDVVIALVTDELNEIAEGFEANLGASPPPFWILGPTESQQIVSFIGNPKQGGFAAKKSRFIGIGHAGPTDASQRAAWVARMTAAYPNGATVTYGGGDLAYDSVYWLAYGLAAAGPGAPVNGTSFATGVRKLLAGPKIRPGDVEVVADGFRTLSLGGATFEGTLGPPDIDAARGTWNTVGSVYCFGGDAGNVTVRHDVLRYNRATGTLDGTFDCFPGF